MPRSARREKKSKKTTPAKERRVPAAEHRARADLLGKLREGLAARDGSAHLTALELIDAELALPEASRQRPSELLGPVKDPEIDEVLWMLLRTGREKMAVPLLGELLLTLGRRQAYPNYLVGVMMMELDGPTLRSSMLLLKDLSDPRAVEHLEWFLDTSTQRLPEPLPPLGRLFAFTSPESPESACGIKRTEQQRAQKQAYVSLLEHPLASESAGFLLRLMTTMSDPCNRADLRKAFHGRQLDLVVPLTREMEKGDLRVRQLGVELLVYLDAPLTTEVLVREVVLGELDRGQLVAAALFLGEHGLRALLSMPDFAHWDEVAKFLAIGLMKHKERLMPFVYEGGLAGERALHVFSLTKSSAADKVLIDLAINPDSEVSMRKAAISLLHTLPEGVGEEMMSKLLPDGSITNEMLLAGFRRFERNVVIGMLGLKVLSKDEGVSWRAIQLLEALGVTF